MDIPIPLCIVIIFILLVLSAFFSSSETAFAALNVFKVKVKADEGDKIAKLILKIRERYNSTLTLVLVGYNILAVIMSTLSSLLFFKIFQSTFTETIISLISTAIMTFIVYIFGDMVPKMIACAIPERVARNNAVILEAFSIVLFPIVFIFGLIIKLTNKIFGIDKLPTLTEEDFTNIVDDIQEKGIIEDNESDIIYNSLEFTDTSVRDVLTKRNKIFYIDIKDMPREKLNEEILSNKYSRIPIVYGGIDKIVGVLVVKKYIRAVLKNPNTPILSILQKPYFVDTKIKLDDMIDGFRRNHTHIAIVRHDDKVLGLITMEDVLEELVGKIAEPTNVEGEKQL